MQSLDALHLPLHEPMVDRAYYRELGKVVIGPSLYFPWFLEA
jgi:hypothetical protein